VWIIAGIGLTLAWIAAAGYVAPARTALREGRAARRTAPSTESTESTV
jgi:hypothetical protein